VIAPDAAADLGGGRSAAAMLGDDRDSWLAALMSGRR